ncbi:polyphosphate kinase 1 [Helicobacter sp. 11S02629-2]|uniref:polyphosphate kinase 1 n=1 Tax=Helicobacter sp. 11S02629-2 TaxID=1476195 RepID=UPI000BA6EFE1|nr:polyphosphate kinase 1 [Helicobacter sp. 11S02629-2]PAF45585.1 RNA degradosome polyphosphate kinase [Helicobacter sp. 11S02629-2]
MNAKHDEKQSERFFNRELSWLRFNARVLNEAKANIPLLERLKFIAIYFTNLDEFYMIRVAGLMSLFTSGIIESGADKLTPIEQLTYIREYLHKEKAYVESLYEDIKDELAKNNLTLKRFEQLSKDEKLKMREYFKNYLYPIIVPIVVDATHPFPHLNNLSFAIALKLKDVESGSVKYGIVRIPRVLKRFISVCPNNYTLVEEVVGEFAEELFTGYESLAYVPFRVTRNADMEIEEDEADDFIALMSEGIRARKKGEIVRLEIGKPDVESEKANLIQFIKRQIKVKAGMTDLDIYEYTMPLGGGAFWELIALKEYANLLSPAYVPKILPPLEDSSTSIFSHIDNGDIMLFHPYESFEPVVNFIQQASKDDKVLSIRMTLYRTGKNSSIIRALTEAAENKQVTVLVELKARFDEENNLHWAKALESAGAHVIYGIPNLKVHAKIALVVRQDEGKLKEYVHLSTGNYNSATAKIYTDVSLFTANTNFGKDAIKLFHSLSTGTTPKTYLNTLYTAPTQIKPKLLSLIAGEIAHKEQGHIILKANACVDVDVINALYEASNAGVKIDMIIRGVCCLRPGVKGMSENIRVFSLIGKYLEHARIYYFKHDVNQVYFSSADIMPRNLERRVELLTPVLVDALKTKLTTLLDLQLKDNVQLYSLGSDGEYTKVHNNDKPMSSQIFYEDHITKLYDGTSRHHQKIKKLLSRYTRES